MTAIYYYDTQAWSANGQWKATAVSPHNGSIALPDGTRPADDFAYIYREHQSHFRYRLEDRAGRVIWERWQGDHEDSVAELVVDDDGTVVIRTHGFRPELLVIRPDGSESIRVKIVGEGMPLDASAENHPVTVGCMHDTTAGMFWSQHSWRYFTECGGRRLFVWRTSSHDRIVIAPEAGRLIRLDCPEYARIQSQLDRAESSGVITLLDNLARHKDAIASRLADPHAQELEWSIQDQLRRATGGALVAGIHRSRQAVSALLVLQELDWPGVSTGSTAMRWYWVEAQQLRPLIHHALRLMDAIPGPQPCYYFKNRHGRVSVQSRRDDRASALAKLRPGMRPRAVLQTVGTPDFICQTSQKKGMIYVWPETWEYDEYDGGRWTTIQLRWEERILRSQLTSVQTLEASWLKSDYRMTELLKNIWV